MRSIVENESTTDFIVQSATRNVPEGAIHGIASLRSVSAADVLRNGRAVVTLAGTAPTADDAMVVVGLPAAAFGRSLNVKVVAGSLDALAKGAIAVQEATATESHWSVGSQVRITPQNGTTTAVTATIGAIIDSRALEAPVILPERLYAQVVPAAQSAANTVFVNAAPGTTPQALRADLVAVAAPYVVLSVLDNAQFAAQLADQVNQLLVILYALLGLSIVIAILGIVNTLALSVIERTREIGLMRAVGLGRLQLAGILTIESVLTAMFGTIIGLGSGGGRGSGHADGLLRRRAHHLGDSVGPARLDARTGCWGRRPGGAVAGHARRPPARARRDHLRVTAARRATECHVALARPINPATSPRTKVEKGKACTMSRKYKTLVGLLLFNALSAVGGGIGLVTGTLPVPTMLLRHTPFDSFVIPGLFLGVVIGGSALVGAIAVLAHAKRSRLISAAAGVIMVGWIAGETILVEGFSWLQGFYLLTGLLIIWAAPAGRRGQPVQRVQKGAPR